MIAASSEFELGDKQAPHLVLCCFLGSVDSRYVQLHLRLGCLLPKLQGQGRNVRVVVRPGQEGGEHLSSKVKQVEENNHDVLSKKKRDKTSKPRWCIIYEETWR